MESLRQKPYRELAAAQPRSSEVATRSVSMALSAHDSSSGLLAAKSAPPSSLSVHKPVMAKVASEKLVVQSLPVRPRSRDASPTILGAVAPAALSKTVPPPPFYMSNFVINVRLQKVEELHAQVDQALRTAGVDFEFNPAKWKAKCYVYKPNACCHFVLRCYTDNTLAAQDSSSYIVEMTRRKGCCNIFRSTYDQVLAEISKSGALRPGCPASKRVELLCSEGSRPALPSPAAAGLPLPGLPCPAPLSRAGSTFSSGSPRMEGLSAALPIPNFLRAPSMLAPEVQGPAGLLLPQPLAGMPLPLSLLDPSRDPELDGSGSLGQGGPALAGGNVAEAFTTLSAMLTQPWDDVACPAAQSISALAVANRVRCALGAHVRQAYHQHKAGAANGAAPSLTPVLSMFDSLVRRVVDVASTSVECRTACAMAVANLAQDPDCAEFLLELNSPQALVAVISNTPSSAYTAALRREAMIALGRLILSPGSPRTAGITPLLPCLQQFAADPYVTLSDPVFDTLLHTAIGKLLIARA